MGSFGAHPVSFSVSAKIFVNLAQSKYKQLLINIPVTKEIQCLFIIICFNRRFLFSLSSFMLKYKQSNKQVISHTFFINKYLQVVFFFTKNSLRNLGKIPSIEQKKKSFRNCSWLLRIKFEIGGLLCNCFDCCFH